MTPLLPDALLRAQSDERLLVLAKRGNERAFEALVRRYRTPLVRFCRHMVHDDDLAEDVVQQALMSAWNALHNGADVREIRPWLYRIVRHAALRTLHSDRNNRDTQPLSDSLPERDTPEESLQRRTAVREALTEVAALPEMQREALLLTAFAGHTNARAAEELGLTDTKVRGLLYRARVRLRAACSAITPPTFVSWAASRVPHGSGQLTERLAQTGAGGAGTGGVVALLTKGGVVAASAVAVAIGTVQVTKHLYGHPRHPSSVASSHVGGPTVLHLSSRADPSAASLAATDGRSSLSGTGSHSATASQAIPRRVEAAYRQHSGGQDHGLGIAGQRTAGHNGGSDGSGSSGSGGDRTSGSGSTGGSSGDGSHGTSGSGSAGGSSGDGSHGTSGSGSAGGSSGDGSHGTSGSDSSGGSSGDGTSGLPPSPGATTGSSDGGDGGSTGPIASTGTTGTTTTSTTPPGAGSTSSPDSGSTPTGDS